jgi:putative membrane protein
VSPRLIQAGLDEGRALLDAQAARARAARKRQTSEHWLDQVRALAAEPPSPGGTSNTEEPNRQDDRQHG